MIVVSLTQWMKVQLLSGAAEEAKGQITSRIEIIDLGIDFPSRSINVEM